MRKFAREFAYGLMLAVPVLAGAALAAREVLQLRQKVEELETARLEALRQRDAAVEKLAAFQRNSDRALADRLRAAADAADSEGEAQQRLAHVIDFLKKEISTAEATIDGLKKSPTAPAAGAPPRTAELLREITRLNQEIEGLRGELEQLKKGQ